MNELKDIAIAIAIEAGEHIRKSKPVRVTVLDTKSTPTDVVTAMDREVEDRIRLRLRELRPQDGFLGEESGGDVHEKSDETSAEASTNATQPEITWVVDPIDGTVNYLYGIEAYAVSIAAVTGGSDPATWQVVAGAVHDVVHGTTWSASLGGGAFYEGESIHVSEPQELRWSLVGTGFGYSADRRAGQARVLATVLPRVRDIRRIGSAALDLCRVADGRLDAFFERGMNPWDHAAGELIIREAGGLFVGLRGAAPGESMAVAGTNPAVSELVYLLEESGADNEP